MLFALARSLRSEFAPTRVKVVALLASLVAALVAGIWIVQVIAIQRLLYQDAVSTGHLWASYMAENVGDLAAIAEGKTPSAASVAFFERAQKVGNVFRYKVFSPEGHLRLVSDQLSVAGTDAQNLREHNVAAAGATAAGRPMVVAKTGKPPARPPFFSEAYVPVIVGGRTIAIVEAYVDQSDKREHFYSVLSIAAISLSLLVLLAFGVPAAAYIRTREKQTASLNAALASMSQGLAIFDANQRIVIANRRYGEMYDLPPERIKPGTPLREILAARAAKGIYDNESTKEWVERGLATFHKEASDVLHLSDGRVISVLRRPMSNGGLVSTHEDITQQDRLNARIEYQHRLIKAQEERLKAKNLLATALDNMGEGLCMFDADRRLLVCNDRYAKLYQLPQELLAVGTPHDAIIAHRVSNGILKGDKSGVAVTQKLSALGQLPAERSSSRIDELADGRLICVTRQPMTGGGWVATHEDISARVLAERHLEETKKFLDTVIESLPVPVIVKEPNALQFVLVNQAYEKFVGVSRENLLGKSCTRFLTQSLRT
ncbi:MAG: PAS domain-containing protein [Rhodospirillales bacterium]|nr:PAS domain-containing protein [Rhodospirillales bacterium]